jgi:hypothetical protein
MAFTGNYMCTSFKQQLLQAKHDFTASTGHTFKIALYTSSATLNASTTNYSASSESSGTGYTAGGATLTNITPTTSGTTALCDFADVTFSSATITARGALIYNTTTGGGSGTTDSVLVLDFGSERASQEGDFVVRFPTADATNAILRIA